MRAVVTSRQQSFGYRFRMIRVKTYNASGRAASHADSATYQGSTSRPCGWIWWLGGTDVHRASGSCPELAQVLACGRGPRYTSSKRTPAQFEQARRPPAARDLICHSSGTTTRSGVSDEGRRLVRDSLRRNAAFGTRQPWVGRTGGGTPGRLAPHREDGQAPLQSQWRLVAGSC